MLPARALLTQRVTEFRDTPRVFKIDAEQEKRFAHGTLVRGVEHFLQFRYRK